MGDMPNHKFIIQCDEVILAIDYEQEEREEKKLKCRKRKNHRHNDSCYHIEKITKPTGVETHKIIASTSDSIGIELVDRWKTLGDAPMYFTLNAPDGAQTRGTGRLDSVKDEDPSRREFTILPVA